MVEKSLARLLRSVVLSVYVQNISAPAGDVFAPSFLFLGRNHRLAGARCQALPCLCVHLIFSSVDGGCVHTFSPFAFAFTHSYENISSAIPRRRTSARHCTERY